MSVFRWQNSNKEWSEHKNIKGLKKKSNKKGTGNTMQARNASNSLYYVLCWIVKLLTQLKTCEALIICMQKWLNLNIWQGVRHREWGGRFLNMIGAMPLKISFCDLRILKCGFLMWKSEMLWDLLNPFTRVQNADVGVPLSYLPVCTIIHIHTYFLCILKALISE
jgi:hypothetical protein